MTAGRFAASYGRATVRLGVILLILSVAYLVQVAAIVANVRHFRTENAA
jgi:hypothetical protein